MDISKIAKTRILLIGDIMLDRFEYGKVDRISPEAPVPVFKPTREKLMLGGIGNVAANLVALGCQVRLVSRTGKDNDGKIVLRQLDDLGVDAHLHHQTGCSTTVKTRLIAGNNHLLRIDRENPFPLSGNFAKLFVDSCLDRIDNVDIVILSDYAKGVLTPEVCQGIIRKCRARSKMVIVDPKGTDYAKYAGACLIKPNLKELSLATGIDFNPEAKSFRSEVIGAARSLAKRLKLNGMLVTLSELGMIHVAASAKEPAIQLPTQAREVFDVSGAGDTAIAALGAALGAGMSMTDAMSIANAASGIVVGKLGTATATLQEIQRALTGSTAESPGQKIVTVAELVKLTKRLKSEGKTIGFTNGCFDCCHLGHLNSFLGAKALCDVLVVGVNSDAWIRRHKGKGRPIQNEATRTTLIAALECVNYVVVFDTPTAEPLVRKLRPDVIAKEGYALRDWPEGRLVSSYGGKAVTLAHIDGYSTTATIERMERAKGKE